MTETIWVVRDAYTTNARADPPFYLVREPEAKDHAWPVDPDLFEAWYEEVPA